MPSLFEPGPSGNPLANILEDGFKMSPEQLKGAIDLKRKLLNQYTNMPIENQPGQVRSYRDALRFIRKIEDPKKLRQAQIEQYNSFMPWYENQKDSIPSLQVKQPVMANQRQSLFDVPSNYAIDNKELFESISKEAGSKAVDLPDDNNKTTKQYALGEIAYLSDLLKNNPEKFEEIRNKVNIHNAMSSIGIYGHMPKEYSAFNRLSEIIAGRRDPGFTPWQGPKFLKEMPMQQSLPNPNKPNDKGYIWANKFMKRPVQEI